jgi:hypothetical protein
MSMGQLHTAQSFYSSFGSSHTARCVARISSQSLSLCSIASISRWCSGQYGCPGLPQKCSGEVREARYNQLHISPLYGSNFPPMVFCVVTRPCELRMEMF